MAWFLTVFAVEFYGVESGDGDGVYKGENKTRRGEVFTDWKTALAGFLWRGAATILIEHYPMQKMLDILHEHELHANEIVLLAYYIAAINIEETFHGLRADANGSKGTDDYLPFEGICLTDTFQLYESGQMELEGTFPENNKRVKRQKESPIRVVVANPPYSAQQASENDNNQNLVYPVLDQRIRSTYAERSNAKLVKNLYDSYIRAIRWASDRIKDKGVIGFVTNGSFIDANNMDGLRGSLTDEFTSLYVFNLRGNQRTSGELSRQEGGKIFGSGSRAPISITLLVKNPAKKAPATLRYHDIGDYLDRNEKLKIIRTFTSVNGLGSAKKWTTLHPNAENDWINQRDPAFEKFIVLGDKDNEKQMRFFDNYSQGLLTARDKWCHNFSSKALASNMSRMIEVYDEEMTKAAVNVAEAKKTEKLEAFETVIDTDPKKIAWSGNLKADGVRGKKHKFYPAHIVTGMFRPFSKEATYFDRSFNERVYQLPTILGHGKLPNLAICVDSRGSTKEFSTLVVDTLPDYECISKGQCFPLYLYEPAEESGQLDLRKSDGEVIDGYRRRDAITDRILSTFGGAYGKDVTKEDIFYYVYGVLHSPEYRTRFAADLKKMLPRIPLTKETRDFWAFSQAGRELAQWHLNYETVEPWNLEEQMDRFNFDPSDQFKVTKMTFARPTPEQKEAGAKWDKSKILYNSHVTLSGIPLDASEYVVNGKPAIEWILERYQVTRDKDSGIVNDPNDWCMEHNQPRYIIDLLKRVVRVSLETMKIVKRLPALNERSDTVGQAEAKVRLRFVQPKPEDRYVTCVPLVPLKVAAGTFGDPQHLEHENFDWVEVQSKHRLRPGMFVAQVNGRSMEPMIPDGSYCLFASPVEGSRQGKTVLVRLRDEVDPETAQHYTVKRYESQTVKTGDSWRHARITLKPLNPEFEDIELANVSEDQVSVIAEWVEVMDTFG